MNYVNPYLINIIKPNNPIKCAVQIIQQVHNLHGCRACTEFGEAHNIAEVHSHALETLGLHHLACHELLSYWPM